MSGNGNQVPLVVPTQRGPGSYPRVPTPHRGAECYHSPGGGVTTTYMQAPNPGAAQSPAPAAMRIQTAPQSAAPAPPQDISKSTMAGHNYVSTQSSSSQARTQYPNYQYRPTQHGPRPTTHPRQQQPFMSASGASGTSPMIYQPTLMFPPPHMGIPQSYQSPRAFCPYQNNPYINYNINAPGQSFFYASSTPQLPAPSIGGNGSNGRANNTNMVGPPPTSGATPTGTLTHHIPQTTTHMHQNMTSLRQPANKRSHRLAIIDPATNKDIFCSNFDNNQFRSGDSSERQTPQPVSDKSVAEEFSRMVTAAVKESSGQEGALKSNCITKSTEPSITLSTPISTILQTQTNASSINNNSIVKTDVILSDNDNKTLLVDATAEAVDPPEVSALSDSPVIVPKICPTILKQKYSDHKVSEPQTPVVVDGSKHVKASKVKPVVPQSESEKPVEYVPMDAAAPLPQRVPRERIRNEDKPREKEQEKFAVEGAQDVPVPDKTNGPVATSSVDSLKEVINPITSQNSQYSSLNVVNLEQQLPSKVGVQTDLITEPFIPFKGELSQSDQPVSKVISVPPLTGTELLSADIEAVQKTHKAEPAVTAIIIDTQAKLSQNIVGTCPDDTDSVMKDINLNNKNTDQDSANGNMMEEANSNTDNSKDINRNVKCTTDDNVKFGSYETSNEVPAVETESYANGKDETDKLSQVEKDNVTVASEEAAARPQKPAAFVPKYHYSQDQWSPLNTAGKKCYDLMLLKQIKDDPVCKNKPDDQTMLQQLNVMRTMPMPENVPFTLTPSRATTDLLPNFAIPRNVPMKKEGRIIAPGKGSVKLTPNPVQSKVIHVSLSLREDVKLNETKNAWKPTRLKKQSFTEEEAKTQELYNNFRGILNKLTPQKFDTLLEKVKLLEIDNQERLKGVIDLVFEKAIDEPNFSEAYAGMCNKLSKLKVPSDESSDKFVNFRALIISKCQEQFETNKVDEHILTLEKNISECTDLVKKKEMQVLLEEENRRMRMRSVGNVRFIGQLYKLKMLTAKIMVYCMNYLIDKLEEEKLECLCKLLTTIGEQVQSEVKEQLDTIFKKMQDIVDRRSNVISSRVRFMIQDVIALRRRRWVVKTVIDLQPKTMDQIQKEAEQQHRQTELLNSPMGNSYRRDDGGRKRGDGRRQGQNSFMDTNYMKTMPRSYSVDTSKFKAVATTNKNFDTIKLAPQKSGWTQGSGTKTTAQSASSSVLGLPTTTNNMYSVLENAQTDPTSLRGFHSKGASIERSTFNSRVNGPGSRSGSMGVRSSSEDPAPVPPVPAPPVAAADPVVAVAQVPITEAEKKFVKSTIDLFLMSPDEDLKEEIKARFQVQHHAAIVAEISNVAFEKSSKEIIKIAQTMPILVTSNTISPENFVKGLSETFEFAPDLFIDIPMLYDYLGTLIAPLIEKKNITFKQIFSISENMVAANQGHLLLRVLLKNIKESMGPTFAKTKWQECGLELKQWMPEDKISKFIEDNKLEFLAGGAQATDESAKALTPAETQKKLLFLLNAEESCDCIRGWVKDNLDKSTDEDWFMRALIQAISENALFGPDNRDTIPSFNQDRMNKYVILINDFGTSKQSREANCLFGIQQLIHRLEHPQGLTLAVFQYLHEQYIISDEGFTAWEESEQEPEGKGVMLKVLTSFFTNIKEADNEDSCSED